MEYAAPAKVNLYLKVLSKRKDGYHDIETLFERINIFDRISIKKISGETRLACDDNRIPLGPQSLIGKTVTSFEDLSGARGFDVRIRKEIPVGAGLGGGSSDVATILYGMNEVAGTGFCTERLTAIGKSLGADVPFFLCNSSFAVGEERGDVIKKVDTDLLLWHVLVNPPVEVSTKDIYEAVDPLGLTGISGIDRIMTVFSAGNSPKSIAANLRNDLQGITLEKHRVIHDAIERIKKTGAEGVLMSGSGPTVFGVFPGENEARRAEALIKKSLPAVEGWKTFLARTC